MSIKNELSFPQVIQVMRLQIWMMSVVCLLLGLFATAAASRIPFYLATSDYARFTGTVLFVLLVLTGVVDNLRTHLCLWRLTNETRPELASGQL